MKLKKKYNLLFPILIWIGMPNYLFGQGGGRSSFDFMNLPSNARSGATGGRNVSSMEADVNLLFSNPALISENWHNLLAVNYLSYYAGISLSSVAYALNTERYGTWAAGLQYLDLGEFRKRDDTGLEMGEFRAQEYLFSIGRSHKSGNFQAGAALKYANSTIDIYTAHAVLFDLGAVFVHPDQEFTVGMAIKNLGFKLGDYSEAVGQKLPFDAQLGMTIKPEHMPVRFTVTGHHLTYFRLLYDNKSKVDTDNNDGMGVVDKVLSHVNLGSEILLSRNFNVRGGYNHMINKELGLVSGSKGSGFSYGFMLRIRAFEFAFGRATYHASGGRNFFSLQSNLNEFFNKDTN